MGPKAMVKHLMVCPRMGMEAWDILKVMAIKTLTKANKEAIWVKTEIKASKETV